jgi:hypothetical protein
LSLEAFLPEHVCFPRSYRHIVDAAGIWRALWFLLFAIGERLLLGVGQDSTAGRQADGGGDEMTAARIELHSYLASRRRRSPEIAAS